MFEGGHHIRKAPSPHPLIDPQERWKGFQKCKSPNTCYRLNLPAWMWRNLWLGAVRQQAITWARVDQDRCDHMASLGHNELTRQGHLNQCGIIINQTVINVSLFNIHKLFFRKIHFNVLSLKVPQFFSCPSNLHKSKQMKLPEYLENYDYLYFYFLEIKTWITSDILVEWLKCCFYF